MSQVYEALRKAQGQAEDPLSASANGRLARPEPALQEVPVDEVDLQFARRIALSSDPHGLGADRFRLLRMRLRELAGAGKLKTLLVTSPLPQEGKSTVAMNLATALAEHGRRNVLLVDADLHHSSVAHDLGLTPRPGLAECIETGADPLSAVRRLQPLAWYVLQSGTTQGNPADLFHPETFSPALARLSLHFDWILLDGPPVIPLTDAISLSRLVDAALLVARVGQTPREALDKSISLIGRGSVLGIVLNGVEGLNRLYSYNYGRYYSRNGSGKQAGDTNRKD